MQNSPYIKDFRGWGGIGIASDVQVVIVLPNLLHADHSGVTLFILVGIEGSNDMVNVLLP